MTRQEIEDAKHWIDSQSYVALLHRWRFSPCGDVYFSNPEVSAYYVSVMSKKREAIGDGGHVAASKQIGW